MTLNKVKFRHSLNAFTGELEFCGLPVRFPEYLVHTMEAPKKKYENTRQRGVAGAIEHYVSAQQFKSFNLQNTQGPGDFLIHPLVS